MQLTQLSAESERLQARFGLRVSACLSEQAQLVPHSVGERLRCAREQALDRARAQRNAAMAPVSVQGSEGAATLSIGSGPGFASGWWIKLASVLPLLVLIAGLLWIQRQHVGNQIAVAAEIDAELLGGALPPEAYSDAGFVEFLKIPIAQ